LLRSWKAKEDNNAIQGRGAIEDSTARPADVEDDVKIFGASYLQRGDDGIWHRRQNRC
jgi:hypothetical protein